MNGKSQYWEIGLQGKIAHHIANEENGFKFAFSTRRIARLYRSQYKFCHNLYKDKNIVKPIYTVYDHSGQTV